MRTIMAFDGRKDRLESLTALLGSRFQDVQVIRVNSWEEGAALVAEAGEGEGVLIVHVAGPGAETREEAESAPPGDEDVYRHVFEHSPIGKSLTFLDGRINPNRALCEMLGYTADQLRALRWQDITPAEDIERVQLALAPLFTRERESVRFEKRYVRSDGAIIWGEVSTSLRRDPSGQPLCYMTSVLDITERKTRERVRQLTVDTLAKLNEERDLRAAVAGLLETVREATGADAVGLRLRAEQDYPYFDQEGFSEDFLLAERSLLVRDPAGGLCHDEAGAATLACLCGQVLTGRLPSEDPSGTPYGTFWTNDSRALLEADSGPNGVRYGRYRCILDGYASIALIPIRAGRVTTGLLQINGRAAGLFTRALIEVLEGLCANLGQALLRRQAEDSLRAVDARLHGMFDHMSSGVAVYRPVGDGEDFEFLDYNAAAERSTGVTRGELLGRRVTEVFPGVRDFGLFEVFSRVHRTGVPEHHPSMLYQDGRLAFWTENYVYRLPTGELVAIFDDETERRQAEKERELLMSQLLQAQKLESVGRLAGGVAHDFNNMLGVIQGHAELALEHLEPSQPLHGDLQEILRVAKRSTDLTRQLLAFARRQTVNPRPLDLNRAVEGMLRMLRRLIGEDVSLVWRPGDGPATVRMDPTQVDQILANLCVNARDAITGAGRITIETGIETLGEDVARPEGVAPGDYVRLTVSDDGCGMDEETRLHAFEPFFTTKESGQGTGLGLATVYGIVRQNEGVIRLESAPGRGTRCVLWLPWAELASVVEAPEKTPEATSAGESILLVEDEPANLRVTRLLLERLGYRVTGVGTPAEALALDDAVLVSFDLLLTDVVMPGMNGRELAGRLARRRPGLRCLFMSGYTADVIAHHGILEGGVDFIQKPFSKTVLAARLRAVLDRPTTP